MNVALLLLNCLRDFGVDSVAFDLIGSDLQVVLRKGAFSVAWTFDNKAIEQLRHPDLYLMTRLELLVQELFEGIPNPRSNNE